MTGRFDRSRQHMQKSSPWGCSVPGFIYLGLLQWRDGCREMGDIVQTRLYKEDIANRQEYKEYKQDIVQRRLAFLWDHDCVVGFVGYPGEGSDAELGLLARERRRSAAYYEPTGWNNIPGVPMLVTHTHRPRLDMHATARGMQRLAYTCFDVCARWGSKQ